VVLWWLALFGWWVVVMGTHAGLELVAAACAALLGALLALALRGAGLKLPWKIAHELGIVLWALALNLAGLRRLSCRYRAFELPADGEADARRRVR